MTTYFSKSAGFLDTAMHSIPEDAVEISSEQHQQLLASQAAGCTIKVDADGAPYVTEADSPSDDFWEDRCKRVAKQMLANTDWAVLPDVGLANRDKFIEFRATLRQLVINPVTNPKWPTLPVTVWATDAKGE